MANTPIVNWDKFSALINGEQSEGTLVNEETFADNVKKRAEQVSQAQQYRAQQLALHKADEASWVGRMGLDKDGVVGGAVNLGANVVERAGAMLGQVGSTYHTAQAAALDQHIPDEVKLARKRLLQGQATPADEQLLALPEGYLTTEDANKVSYAQRVNRERSGFRSNLERIQEMEEKTAKAQNAREFWTKDSWFNEGITLKSRSEALTQDAKTEFKGASEDWDLGAKAYEEGDYSGAALNATSAIGKAIAGVGSAAIKNPQAAAELIANQVPQFAAGMLFGAPGMVGTSLIYAIDEYSKGVQAYQKKHGQLPPEEENQAMAAKAAGLMVAEFAGQYVTLGAGKRVMKALTPAVREAGEETTESALRAAARRAVQIPLSRVAVAGIEGTVGEAFTEGTQTALEKSIVGETATPEDIYVGATLGAIAGGGMSAGSRALNESAQLLTGQSNSKPAQEEAKPKTDAEALLPENVQADPSRAMEVLVNYSRSATASPEQKSANLEKADEVLQAVEQEYELAKEDFRLVHPQYRARVEAGLPKLQEELAALPEDAAEERASLEAAVKRAQDFLAQAPSTPVEQKAAQAKMKKLEQQVSEARNLRQQMEATTPNATAEDDQIEDTPEAVQAAVEQITRAVDTNDTASVEQAKSAASKVVSLAMRMSESLTEDQVTAILAAPNAGLTTEQSTFLRKFSEARTLENTFKKEKDVQQEIYFGKAAGQGSTPMKGIKNYRDLIGSALARGKEKAAKYELGLLSKFAADHRAKIEAIKEAHKKAGQEKRPFQAQKNELTGKWFVTDVLLDEEARRENGAIEIRNGSSNYDRQIAAIELEAKTLEAVRDELTDAVALKFGTTQATPEVVAPTVGTEASANPKSVGLPRITVGKADGWLNANAQVSRDQADMLGLTSSIESLFAEGLTAQQVGSQLAKEGKLDSIPMEERIGFITNTRATLGIPSQMAEEGKAEFAAWKQARDARGSVDGVATSNQLRSSVVDSEAAPAAVAEQTEVPLNQSNVDSTVDLEVSEQSTEAQDAPAEITEVSFQEATPAPVAERVAQGVQLNSTWATSVPERTVSGPRLKANPALTQRVSALYESLMGLADSAGWSQVGGKILRNAMGEVYDRTTWIPNGEWFGAGMEGRPDVIRAAINAVLAGKNVYAKQRRTIEAMLEYDEYKQGQYEIPEEASANDMKDMPDIEGAQDIIDTFDNNFDPEGDNYITMDDFDAIFAEEDNGTQTRTEEGTTVSKAVGGSVTSGSTETNAGVSEESGSTEDEQSEQDEDTTEVAAGKLSVFLNKIVPEGLAKVEDVAKAGVRLVAYYTQRVGGKEKKDQRPLVAVKDLIETFRTNRGFIYDFLTTERTKVTDEQRTAIKDFFYRADMWSKFIPGLLYDPAYEVLNKKGEESNRTYSFQKPLSDFIIKNEDGTLDMEENVKVAIVAAVYGAALELSGRGSELTPEQVNRALGRPEYAEVTQAEHDLIQSLGSRVGPLRHTMGQRVMASLGIKPKKNAPLDDVARMEAAFGSLAMAVARQTGLFQTEVIGNDAITSSANLVEETGLTLEEATKKEAQAEKDERKLHEFIQVARDADGKPIAALQQILDRNKGSKSILDEFLGVEKQQTAPVFEKPGFKQKLTKLGMGIPNEERKLLEVANSRKWYLNKDAWYTLVQMDRDTVIAMAGGTRFDPERHHISNKKSMQAKYEALGREWDLIQDFVNHHLAGVDENLDAPFYLPHEVWSQQRVGIASTIFNPQMSKLARFLSYQEGWTGEVDTAEPTSYNAFKLRVLEGLGVNTGKEANENSLKRLQALFNRDIDLNTLEDKERAKVEAINDAVDVLVESIHRELTPADHEVIRLGVAAGGEKMHSYNAIQGLVALREAQLSGEGKFSATVIGEIDGVSNGPVLAHAYYGAAATTEDLAKFLKRGGFYTEEDAVEGYNIWRSKAGSLDIYEKMTDTADAILRERMAGAKNENVYKAVLNLVGDLKNKETITKEGRDLSKDPVRPLVFGSTLRRAIESMGEAFVENLYKQIEQLPVEDTKADTDKRNAFINSVNVLLGSEAKLRLNMSKAQLLNTQLQPQQIKAIKESFGSTFGSAFESAVEQELEHFLKTRKQVVQASDLIAKLFSAVYDTMREEYVAQLLAEGKISKRQDLSQEQEAELAKRIEKMIPTMHTAFSVGEGRKGLKNGLPIMYREVKTSEDSRYQAETPLKGLKDGEGKRPSGKQWKYTSPGVRMTSMPIHSSDAAKSFRGDPLSEGGNNHDARTMGLPVFNKIGEGLNRATWETMLEYSPLDELANTLEDTIKNLRTILDQKNNPPALNEKVAQALVDFSMSLPKQEFIHPEQVLNAVITNLRYTAREANIKKLGVLAQVVLIDQYSSEGAGFKVDAEMRKVAEDKLNALEAQKTIHSKELEQAIDTATDRINPLIQPLLEQAQAKAGAKAAYRRLAKREKIEVMQLIRALAQANPEQKGVLTKLWDAYRNVETLTQALATAGIKETDADALVQQIAAKAAEVIDKSKHTEGNKWWGYHAKEDNGNNEPTLIAAFKKNGGELSGKEAIAVILKELDKLGVNTFTRMLAERLGALVSDKITLTMVTPYTDPDLLLNAAEFTKVKGLYQSRREDGAQAIYILGDRYTGSKVDTELLLHEILHSVLFNLIRTSTDPKVLAAKAELESLRGTAKKFVESMRVGNSSFSEATKNLDEFISYGMTNRAFQDQVLRPMKMTITEKVVSGFQGFVRGIARMLFPTAGKSSEVLETGLGQFLVHVSTLLDLADQQTETVDGSAAQAILTFSTVDILQALPGSTSNPAFVDHLRSVLESIVEKLHGPAGSLRYDAMQTAPVDALDAWTQAQLSGQAQFSSQMGQSGIVFTEQERFVAEQVEATVQAALKDSASMTSLAVKELEGVYAEARQKLTPEALHEGDWATATQQEQDRAQKLHDFLFKMEAGKDGRTDHLSRFAALGLTNPRINQLLGFKTKGREKLGAKATLAQRLRAAFDQLLDWLTNTVNHTKPGQQADTKLQALVERLVQIEIKRARKEAHRASLKNHMGKADSMAQKGMDFMQDKAVQIGQSNFVQNNLTGAGKLAGEVLTIVAKNQVIPVMTQIMKMKDQYLTGRQSLVSGIIREVKHPAVLMQKLFRHTKKMEQDRQHLISNTRRMVLNSFTNQGKDLTDSQGEAVTYVFLRSEAHVLLDDYSLQDLQTLLENPKALEEAIQTYKDQLTGKFSTYYNEQSIDLGYFLATEIARNSVLPRNAGNIARMYGTSYDGQVTEADAVAASKIIDKLVTLYAIKYNDSARVKEAAAVLAVENARTDNNGVEMILKLHKEFRKESEETLFAGQHALMHKGHLVEIINPYNDIKAVPLHEAQDLINQGYEMVSSLWKDGTDPNPDEMVLLRMVDGGLSRYQSGMFSMTGTNTKGSTVHNGFLSMTTQEGKENIQEMRRQKKLRTPEVDALMKGRKNYDPSKAKKRYMVPVMNPRGKVVNYAYTMSADVRDDVLQRDNRFEEILGAFAGSIFDKQMTPQINRDVLQALRDMYMNQHKTNKKGLVNVGMNSPNAEMRELYARLPEETRRDMKTIWGKDGVWVEPELLDLVFGYPKPSAANVWKKDPKDRAFYEKIFVAAVENALYVVARHYMKMSKADAEKFKQRSAMYVRRGGRGWTEVVQKAKTNIVVRTGVVMLDNILSNTTYLRARGMPLSEILYHTRVAMKAVNDYQEHSKRLHELEMKLAMDYKISNRTEVEREITWLKGQLAANPAKPLIDLGALPTIAEDVLDTQDIYSYKTWLSKKTEKYTNKVSPKIRNVVNMATLGEDTKAYKFLRDMTQMSDFVGRYALYQHLTTRSDNRLDGDTAFQNVMESFVQYDMPLHPKLQYMDDHGLFMFMKYFLRMQKVLIDLVRDKPLNTLMMVLAGHWFSGLPVVTDSAMITRIGNIPLESGAFQYPDSVLQIAPINMGMELLK